MGSQTFLTALDTALTLASHWHHSAVMVTPDIS